MTELMNALDKMTEARQAVHAFSSRSDARRLVGEAFAHFFELAENVDSITWTQGAPSFNDGDPCYFRVHEPIFRGDPTRAAIEDEEEDEDWDDIYESNVEVTDEASYEFDRVWSRLDEDLLQSVFGEASKVTISRNEVSCEDWYNEY